MDVEGEVLL